MAVAIASLSLLSGWCAALARADGDPASDVLVSQVLFLPQDAGIPAGQQAQLEAVLAAGAREGYRLRVALIASPIDLGSIGELWRQPQSYAQFLGQELSLLYGGPLLVVMPNGYGVFRAGRPHAREQSALAGLPPAGGGLGTATLTAIQRLAAASGHPLPLPSATTAPSSSPVDVVSWLVFALGGALIALAWMASLRARPLRAGGTPGPGSAPTPKG